MAKRILVVDDSATIRSVVGKILERRGYDVLTAADGALALAALMSANPKCDLAIVDFHMPRVNGLQFCRAVRGNDELKDVGLVLMSATSDRLNDPEVQSKVLDVITKPFDARGLVAMVENALARHERRSHLPPAPILPPSPLPPTIDAALAFALNEEGSRPSPAPPVSPSQRATAPDLGRISDPGPNSLALPPKLGDVVRASIPPSIGVAALPRGAEGKVVLTADLASVALGAILQLLQLENKTGVLTVRSPSGSIVIHLRDGLIDLVRSRGAGPLPGGGQVRPQGEFRLGRYLIEEGLVKPDELDALLKERDQTSPLTPLGDLLVSRGKATEKHLRDALARQSSELVYDALRWEHGTLSFALAPAEALAVSARLTLPVASVVMEGFRRVDEWRLMESKLGRMDEVLMKDTVALDKLGDGQLSKAEQTVLAAIDGKRSIREIIDATYMSSFDVCRAIYQFLEARLVRRKS